MDCYILANICEADAENSFQLFQNGLTEIVVRLVNCNHIEVKRQALRCLSSMCAVVKEFQEIIILILD